MFTPCVAVVFFSYPMSSHDSRVLGIITGHSLHWCMRQQYVFWKTDKHAAFYIEKFICFYCNYKQKACVASNPLNGWRKLFKNDGTHIILVTTVPQSRAFFTFWSLRFCLWKTSRFLFFIKPCRSILKSQKSLGLAEKNATVVSLSCKLATSYCS